MNLELMRRERTVGLFLEAMRRRYPLQDQDVLNAVCRDRVDFLPSRFNFLTYLLDRDLDDVLEVVDFKNEVLEAIRDPVVIHYAGGSKPWDDGSLIWSEDWIDAYSRSVFCDRDRLVGLLEDLRRRPNHSPWRRKRGPGWWRAKTSACGLPEAPPPYSISCGVPDAPASSAS